MKERFYSPREEGGEVTILTGEREKRLYYSPEVDEGEVLLT
jgi:hypothetical protein